ncbi:2-hydroxyacid dehydrogenase [Gracilibacillus salinarum]|uniref:D-glycerate dehydrogenase n=1 Tax=Gracilibacillus salinarum TaxID=2932255 RepID=A0ABY4GLP5_9BACI|nr:D-glycerate dehydrogenase [Gracilibacillus salinarum]UOQ84875.1 D-glycerate dehydrogenase [Gracilibacillus salinarum]
MKKAKVMVYNRVSGEVQEKLKTRYNVVNYQHIDPLNHELFLADLKDTEGIIGLELPVTEKLLQQAPLLKIVCNVSTGYNNLDIEAMTKYSVMATNTPGVLEETTADAVFGILLATARRIPELHNYLRSGGWKQYLTHDQFGVNVHHKTIGIIGMGTIGSLIAKRAHGGFNMNVLYHNRTRNEDAEKKYNATYCEMNTLLTKADFICLMTPLTPSTKNLIGKREFDLMKSSAIFINGSRGATVDETALIEALKQKKIRAAGLDVYRQEPVNHDNELLQLTNVVTTPHIGSSTYETELAMSRLAAQNLIEGLSGKKPANLINKELFIQTEGNEYEI